MKGAAGTWLLAGSVLLSAFLLFTVQPLVAQLLLPRYGGSAAVWNTSVVFFQVVLLGGYAYAHWSQRLPVRARTVLHVSLLAVALLFLPPRLPPPNATSATAPFGVLVLSLGLVIGLPFFILSSNSTLVQRWFAQSGQTGGREPYRLYAASNLGSLVALLAYPMLIARIWGLDAQGRLWSIGYAAFFMLSLALVLWVGGRDEAAPHGIGDAGSATGLSGRRRLLWAARAAAASGLMLGVTMVVTTDLAPVPLLWVIPLALYLGTFILAFSSTISPPRRPLVGAYAVAAAACLIVFLLPSQAPLAAALLLPLVTLALGALVCHLDLAADRPAPAHLTEYYLWVSLGGALGGILSSLVSPLLFDTLAEYPFALLAVLALAFVPETPRPRGVLARDLVIPLILILACAWSASHVRDGAFATRQLALFVPMLVLLIGLQLLYLGRHRDGLVAFACTSLLVVTGAATPVQVVEQARSFYGAQKVVDSGGFRLLMHGSTQHGIESLDPDARAVPASYYHPEGPLGQAVLGAAPEARIAVVGLGTGALAGACLPEQSMRFYEIDALVLRLAREHFHYLEEAACLVDVRLGDGRLTLAEDEGEGAYDRIVIDAFSSGAIPTHLLTVEALSSYANRLADGGGVFLHVSNRYLDLPRVLAANAPAAGLVGSVADWSPSSEARAQGASAATVVVLAESDEELTDLLGSIQDGIAWRALRTEGRSLRPWTDDYVNLLAAFRRREDANTLLSEPANPGVTEY